MTARGTAAWSGLLPVDKSTGVTSHDVVDRARRVLGTRAVGHLGTLDPGASGLLVLVVGSATRCGLVWQGGEKTYTGRVRFGFATDTQDLSGRVTSERPVTFGREVLEARTDSFIGPLQQVPPMVSAVKHRGVPLHRLARRGETVERTPRPIVVHAWRWTAVALPDAEFEIRCSGGTYVRTLAHDLGESLGCGAALASLRRTRSEPFDVADAAPAGALAGPADALLVAHGIPLDRALQSLPAVILDPAGAARLAQGQQPVAEPAGAPVGAGPRSVVFRDSGGRALALGELCRDPAGGVRAHPHVVLPPPRAADA